MECYNCHSQSSFGHISIGMKAPDFYANTTFDDADPRVSAAQP